MRYDSAFTFIYSPRQGTEAAELPDQVPDEVKHERLERLVEVVQRIAAERNAERVGTRRGGARRRVRAEPTRRLLRGRTRGNTMVNFTGDAVPGELVDVLIAGATSTTLRGAQRTAVAAMRVLITGSSGQIGTNLALGCKPTATRSSASTSAQNTWTDDFRYLLQDLAGHYASFPGGINGVEYPEADIVVHLAAHAKVHQLVREPHRALENAVMTFNVLEYARQQQHADRVLLEPRGLRRRPPLRGVRRVDRRLRLHGEHLLGLEDRRRGVHLLVRPLLRPAVPRLPLLERLRALRQRPAPHGARDAALHPRDARAASRSRSTAAARRRSTSPTSTTASTGSCAGSRRSPRAGSSNQTINLAYGQGNTLVHVAERIAAELGVEPDMTIAPSLLGEVTHYVADLSKARELLGYDPQVPLDEGIARAVAWFREHREAHPEENVPVAADHEGSSPDDVEHGWKTVPVP